MVKTVHAEIRVSRGPTDEYESYLVVQSKGKTWPYLYIPDEFPDDVLQEVVKRINTEKVLESEED